MAGLTFGAIHEWVTEVCKVPRCFPYLRWTENSCVQPNDIGAHLDHGAPPCIFNISQKEYTKWAVVVGAAKSAVYFGGWKNETSSFTEIDNFVEQFRVGRSHGAEGTDQLPFLAT